MARLEEITVGAGVVGLAGSSPVTVIATKWYGNAVLEVTFKDAAGRPANQLLYRADEGRLEVSERALPWSFDGDASRLRLVSEAYRINLAHLFDPYLAVRLSSIEPLPHQISAVYGEMLPRQPLRYVLADDPGAGKTIMTGLFIKELILRGALRRCLVVSPGSLAEQWQDELYGKFDLRFDMLTNERLESAVTGNAFGEIDFCIARLDKLARNEAVQAKLRESDWDLIVCDEAHKMSATVFGVDTKYTKRFLLGRMLSGLTRHFLLLTATPHNGKEMDFNLFMSLVDQDRFEGAVRGGGRPVDVSDIMRRLVKEDLLKFDGTPIFPERRAYTVNYDLSPEEAVLYDAVTDYVRTQFNRAERLNKERRITVSFALMVLQRRLASSPEAIYQSLLRRRERLEARLREERYGVGGTALDAHLFDFDEGDEDDLPSEELEAAEENLVDLASASRTEAELAAEIETLKTLEGLANSVRQSGRDRKWEELAEMLHGSQLISIQRSLAELAGLFAKDGADGATGQTKEDSGSDKLIVFTEHRDTLRYLTHRVGALLGDSDAVVNIHGGMKREDRRKVEEAFKQDNGVRVLIATDAAGEGINLQCAHLMVNYDLPWNPNRIEQRFGRIHRIGQTETCHLWNMVAHRTREGRVFQVLFDKLEQARAALHGKVYDVLGKLTFQNRSLRDLLVQAVRYGGDPAEHAECCRVVGESLELGAIKKLLAEHALTGEVMDVGQVAAIREDMERAEARKLQPHFIESFFIEAFRGLGGKLKPREGGRFEITHVPQALRNAPGRYVLERYERVCFEKQHIGVPGRPQASLIAPGHPLLDSLIFLVRQRNADVLKRGAIFIDENDPGLETRLLFYIEDSVQDGRTMAGGDKRLISKQLHFVEMDESGHAIDAGPAPYLDYRPPGDDESALARAHIDNMPWLKTDIEERAMAHAISRVIPDHLAALRARRFKLIEKTEGAVKERLTSEIEHWHLRAADLRLKEAAGKPNAKLNSRQASKRAEELDSRLRDRLAELQAEKQISALPPIVVGGAVVLPIGLMDKLAGRASPDSTDLAGAPFSADPAARRRTELTAMRAVMDIELSLGHAPIDVSADKKGYDIESAIPPEKRGPQGYSLRFIEVKGRVKGADTVTVTSNEIRVALHNPDNSILAIVEVDGDQTRTAYLQRPFLSPPDFACNCQVFEIAKLMEQGRVVLER